MTGQNSTAKTRVIYIVKNQRGIGDLINTLLQQGVAASWGQDNRFNGFHTVPETVKTVDTLPQPATHPAEAIGIYTSLRGRGA